MSKVRILQGIPGCGKSTYAENMPRPEIPVEYIDDKPVSGGGREQKFIVSADIYPGLYIDGVWDKILAGEAHRWCLRNFIGILTEDETLYRDSLIIVDNTNTRFEDVHLYNQIARSFYADVEVHYVECLPEVGFARNLHNVPISTIKKMYDNLIYFHTKYANRFYIRNVVDGKIVERGGEL